MIESNLAGVARVAFETTGLPAFGTDVDQAERKYLGATAGMSDGALKLELAQERLRRALLKGPSAARDQARALLSVRQAEREVEAETRRSTAAFDQQDRAARSLGNGLRGNIVPGVSGLKSQFLGLSTGMLASGGVVYGLKAVVDAAAHSEQVLGQTRLAVEASGNTWDQYADDIDKAIQSQSQLGFDDEELMQTFSLLVTRTGDVSEALRLNSLAADVARGRYISLSDAANIVVQAENGQARSVRKLGIEVRQGATAQELLTKLTEEYGGRAEASADSATAAQARLKVALDNTKESVGALALPGVSLLADELARASVEASNLVDALSRGDAQTAGGSFLSLITHTSRLGPGGIPIVAGTKAYDALFGGDNAAPEAPSGARDADLGLATRLDRERDAKLKAGLKGRLARRLDKIEIQDLEAQLSTKDLSDDKAAAQARVDFFRDLIKQENLHGAKLQAARVSLLQAQVRVASIEDQIQGDRDAAARDRQAARDKARAKERTRKQKEKEARQKAAREAKAFIDDYRDMYQDGGLTGNPLQREANPYRAKPDPAKKTGEDGLTRAELSAEIHNFLTRFEATQNRYASNYSTGDRSGTHHYENINELRTQTRIMQLLASKNGFPSSEFSESSAVAAF